MIIFTTRYSKSYQTGTSLSLKIVPGRLYELVHKLYNIGGFHAISGDTNNNGEINKCWWTNKTS